jgi:hypothetical protein
MSTVNATYCQYHRDSNTKDGKEAKKRARASPVRQEDAKSIDCSGLETSLLLFLLSQCDIFG